MKLPYNAALQFSRIINEVWRDSHNSLFWLLDVHILVITTTLLWIIFITAIVFTFSTSYIFKISFLIVLRETIWNKGWRACENLLNPTCSTMDRGYSCIIIMQASCLLAKSWLKVKASSLLFSPPILTLSVMTFCLVSTNFLLVQHLLWSFKCVVSFLASPPSFFYSRYILPSPLPLP